MYIKWLLLTIVNILLWIFNFPSALFVVLFANKDGWLPGWLSWYQTPDNSLYGDTGHQQRWNSTNSFDRYCQKVAWLWRNSMYGFSYSVAGFVIEKDFKFTQDNQVNISNRPLREGRVFRVIETGGKKYWQYYYVKAWTSQYCIRVNLGWKITENPQVGDSVQCVFSPNPFMGYSV